MRADERKQRQGVSNTSPPMAPLILRLASSSPDWSVIFAGSISKLAFLLPKGIVSVVIVRFPLMASTVSKTDVPLKYATGSSLSYMTPFGVFVEVAPISDTRVGMHVAATLIKMATARINARGEKPLK